MVAVVNTWTHSRVISSTFVLNGPASESLDCPVSPGDGSWLIAFCSWTLPPGYLGCTMAVSDDVHGFWIPLGVPNGDSAATGLTRCSIWARPGGSSLNPAMAAGHVYLAPCGSPGPVYPAVTAVTVIEVTGMSAYAGTPAVVTASSNAATSISANVASPGASALMLGVAATDAATWSGGPGSGWTALTGVSVNTTAPGILFTSPAWRVASTSETATWTTTTGDLSAVSAAILVTNSAPSQPNPAWPYTQLLAGFGSGALTPPSEITWTDITIRFLAGKDATDSGGKQYELDQLQAGEIDITLDNNDAALTPFNASSPFYPNVVADTPMRLQMTWNGLTYAVWSGFVERWPQAWDDTWYGISQVTLTDSWSLLTAQLAPCQQEEILTDSPYAYWTMGDAEGSTSAGNSAPGNTNSLQVVSSKSGTLTAAYAFGADAGVDPGDPSGTVWQQSGLTSSDFGYGYCLYCADQNYPSMSGGITVMMWFNVTGGATQPATTSEVLILLRGSNASLGPMFQVHINSPLNATPGALVFRTWDKVTGAVTDTTINSDDWLIAGLTHVTLLINQTHWQALVDAGDFTGASGSCNCPATLSWLTFMGDFDRFHSGGAINAECCHVAVFPRELTFDRINAIVIAGFPVVDNGEFATEHPNLRIERLMGYGGWTGPRSISTTSTLQLAGISDIQGSTGFVASDGVVTAAEGQAAGEAITNIVVTDNGFMSVDGNGVLCYLSRVDLYGEVPQWYLGELEGVPLNENWSLVGVVTPWTASGGAATFVPTLAFTYQGYPAGLLTPDGSTADPGIRSENITVNVGTSYLASAVLNCPAGFTAGANMQIKWLNSSGGTVSTSTGTTVPLAAGATAGIYETATAPAGAATAVLTPFLAGTPTALQFTYVALPMLQPSALGNPGASGIAGEYPYEPDAVLGYDKSLLYNDAELTQSTGTGTPVVAQNPDSIAQHGDFLYSATVYQFQAVQVADEASWIVNTRGTVYNRAETIRVAAGANPLNWPFVLGVQPSQTAQIARRPAGSITVVPAIVTQVARSIDFAAGTFDTTIQTDSFPEGTVLIADDPVRGQLTGLNILAW